MNSDLLSACIIIKDRKRVQMPSWNAAVRLLDGRKTRRVYWLFKLQRTDWPETNFGSDDGSRRSRMGICELTLGHCMCAFTCIDYPPNPWTSTFTRGFVYWHGKHAPCASADAGCRVRVCLSAAQRVAAPERGLSSWTRRDYRVRQGAGHPRRAVRVQPLQLPAVPEAWARGGRVAVRGGGGAAVRPGVGQHAGGACGVAPQPHGTGVL